MKYRVIGDTMPAVEVMFDAPGGGDVYAVRRHGMDDGRH